MASMGALFPQSFGAESSNRARPKRRRQEQHGKEGEPRRRQRGSTGRGAGANWADPTWRKQEIARRREMKARPAFAANPFAGYAAAGVAHDERSDTGDAGAQLLPLGVDQRRVMEAVTERGASVFFTGNAGTGKSYLLRAVVEELNRIHRRSGVFVTASTGIAAANVGGTTLHSFAGIGLGEDDAATMARTLKAKARRRWCDAKVLVIDEISMLDGRLLDKLDSLARNVRNRPAEPFGGIQLILVGDFFQLPPVRLGQDPDVRFCFATRCWEEVVQETFVLRHVYRQRDTGFLAMLDEVRHGTVGPASQALLEKAHTQAASRNPKDWNDDEIKPTRLFSTNRDVDALNERELSQLSGKCHKYEARDQGQGSALRHLQQNCLAPAVLQLKVGAQVMLLKNIQVEGGLTNGTRGVVIGWSDHARPLPRVRFTTGARVGAEAEAGAGAGAENTVEKVIGPEQWTIDEGGKRLAERTQLPLKLAWAITIHKSQGMTISKLELELRDVFEPGMAYVALSRAVSLEGLLLRGYSVSAIRAHPDVERFYVSLHRRLSVGSPSSVSASASVAEPTASHLAEAVGQAGEQEDTGELDASFGSIDWQAVDLTRIDQQAAAAITSRAVKAEPHLVAKSHIHSEPEREDIVALKHHSNDKRQTAAAVMTSRVWTGQLRISTGGTYSFASYGEQPFSLILAGGRELLNNADITRAQISLSPGECSVRIVDNGAMDESVPQELAWAPVPGGGDAWEQERMVTLWRRGGYWAVGGECAPPLVEID